MKVLLTQDVKGLGKAGEIHDVKDGYGNNFLIGKGMAKLATTAVIKQWEAEQRVKKEKLAEEIKALENAKAAMENIKLVIRKKTGANGSLFGAITKEDIAEALEKEHGVHINKKSLEFSGQIKATGSFDLDLKLGHGVHAKLHLLVEAQ